MEKRKPHYNLKEIKRVIRDPNSHPFTASARHGGMELGLTPQEMKEVVLSLSPSDFSKSMTTTYDNRVWQDVYHGSTPSGDSVYIKITCYTDGRPPVISFKAK